MMISKCVLRGFAAQMKKQFLSIKSRAVYSIAMPLAISLTAGIATVFLPDAGINNYIICITLLVATAAGCMPFFSARTLSRERAAGQHFAALEYNHRRGVIVSGHMSANAVMSLICVLAGYAAHMFVSVVALGYIYSIKEFITGGIILISAVILTAAVNTCSSAYSKHRYVCVFLNYCMLLFIAAAVIFESGINSFFMSIYAASVMAAAGIALTVLGYIGYRVRIRAER